MTIPNKINTSPFGGSGNYESAAKDLKITAPFGGVGEYEGNLRNLSIVAPFSYVEPQTGETVTITKGWTQQNPQTIIAGANQIITIEGVMQVIPITGNAFEATPNPLPFGTYNKLGTIIMLIGINDDTPILLQNQVTPTEFGMELNGPKTLYAGFFTQLMLVDYEGVAKWKEILSNF